MGREGFKDKIERMTKRQPRPDQPGHPRFEEEQAVYYAIYRVFIGAACRRPTADGRKICFLDAPLSGGQAGAENGQLTIMVGGDEAFFARAEPIMQVYAKAITPIGPAGSGQLAKAVSQICVAGVLQGLSEGLHFAKRTGLDIEKVIGAISKGAAQSWQMENR